MRGDWPRGQAARDEAACETLARKFADGSLYEAQPGVFMYTPQGIEKLNEEVRCSRRNRLEMERMSRN
jgi:hypothetical protein